jgi:hypothetical protein
VDTEKFFGVGKDLPRAIDKTGVFEPEIDSISILSMLLLRLNRGSPGNQRESF